MTCINEHDYALNNNTKEHVHNDINTHKITCSYIMTRHHTLLHAEEL